MSNQASPTRRRTEEEKRDLQSLNKRLEFYILQQREKDASNLGHQRELDAQREKAEQQLQAERKWHSEQVEMLREQRAETEDALSQKCLEHNTTLADLDMKNRELEKEKAFAQSLLKKIQTLTGANTELSNQLFITKEDLTEVRTELGAEQKHRRDVEKELERCREASAALRQRFADEHKIRLELEDLLAQERTRRMDGDATIARLEPTIKMLEIKLASEDPIRERMIQDHLAELQRKQDILLQDNIDHLEQLNEEKLAGYQEEIEKVGYELGVTKERLNQTDTKLGDATSLANERKITITALRGKIHTLEGDLRDARAALPRALAATKSELNQLKDDFKKKDKLFNDLMDVKVPFDLELKHLEDLLGSEELRLHLSAMTDEPEIIASPPKKKRSAPSNTKATLRSSKKPKKGGKRKAAAKDAMEETNEE